MKENPDILFLLGCTACGKGEVAHLLARELPAEVISLDSMKVYRGLDIGTAKPSLGRQKEVRYHLLDIVEPGDPFSTGDYLHRAAAVLAEIYARGTQAFFVGGTALYYKRLTEGLVTTPRIPAGIRGELRTEGEARGSPALHDELARVDPAAAANIHPNDLQRTTRALEVFHATGVKFSEFLARTAPPLVRPGSFVSVCLRRDRDDLYERINRRVDGMLDRGLVEEVKTLLGRPGGLSRTATQALGYKEVIDLVHGDCGEIETRERIKQKTRNFAKRQMTWFRSFRELRWIDVARDEPAITAATKCLAELRRNP
ncbi:MAG: tRNA (adenosine(37)-N6)-dimethylallyltransferase MiaA [Planctomycetota bacterium]|nr:tRNA (adenosine(37)-N6)-dimethylallyltransferase MiaA [Planctomycetota bacterium]